MFLQIGTCLLSLGFQAFTILFTSAISWPFLYFEHTHHCADSESLFFILLIAFELFWVSWKTESIHFTGKVRFKFFFYSNIIQGFVYLSQKIFSPIFISNKSEYWIIPLISRAHCCKHECIMLWIITGELSEISPAFSLF